MKARLLPRLGLAALPSWVLFCAAILMGSPAHARTTPRSAVNARDFTVNALVISLDSKLLFNGEDLVSAPASLLLLGCGLMSLARVVRKGFEPTSASPKPRERTERDSMSSQSALSPESAQARD